MSLFHRRHKIEYIFRKEVNELYASLTVKDIAFGLITIFEPIYFYLFFDKEILSVLWYFGFVYLGFGLISPLAGKILSRVGIKHSILVSVFFAILYFIGLRSLTTYSSLIYVIPFLSILYKLFFWPAFHLDFARFSQSDRRARQVSILKMITLASGILSPFVGGLIILNYGYPLLFIIVVVLLFTSVVPLFFSKEVYNTFNFSMKDFFRSLFKPAIRCTEIALISWGVEELVSSLIWPIFIFLIIADYSIIGGITSAATVVAFLSAYWIGKLADKKGRRKVLRIGAVLTSLSWIFRSLTANAIQIAFADGVYKLSQETSYIGFTSVIYDKANKKESQALPFILMREVILNTGRFLGIVAIAIIITLTGSLAPAFIFAAISSLFLMFL